MKKQKRKNGKAIYQPAGKAGEYGTWGCNFYVGCLNDCEYCFCPDFLKSGTWSLVPNLKKAFKDEQNAIDIFRKEFFENLAELHISGLFFSFTTDPLLPETMGLTAQAVKICVENGVNVKLLTKRADFIDKFFGLLVSYGNFNVELYLKHLAFGFTLTGHDELEPGASSNGERIQAMKELNKLGYKTFASIEPIVDFQSSMSMIKASFPFCNLYKVGLMSGKGINYNFLEAKQFFLELQLLPNSVKIYLKDSLVKLLGVDRATLQANFVSSDYNMFQ